MIAAIDGILEYQGIDSTIIKVGGVSLQVHIPSTTLSKLGIVGDEVHLYTHLYLREDNVALYGFVTTEELRLFQTLIGISGVGPKLALALLSTLDPEQIVTAVSSGNTDLLSQVPGMGKKMAGRLVLELKGKLEKMIPELPISHLSQDSDDVVAALTALGYSLSEAIRVAANLPDSPELSLEDKVKLALQHLSRK